MFSYKEFGPQPSELFSPLEDSVINAMCETGLIGGDEDINQVALAKLNPEKLRQELDERLQDVKRRSLRPTQLAIREVFDMIKNTRLKDFRGAVLISPRVSAEDSETILFITREENPELRRFIDAYDNRIGDPYLMRFYTSLDAVKDGVAAVERGTLSNDMDSIDSETLGVSLPGILTSVFPVVASTDLMNPIQEVSDIAMSSSLVAGFLNQDMKKSQAILDDRAA